MDGWMDTTCDLINNNNNNDDDDDNNVERKKLTLVCLPLFALLSSLTFSVFFSIFNIRREKKLKLKMK